MIIEGIATTTNEDDSVNISPMGPRVDNAMTHLELRPYRTSTTYRNLKRTREGVFHVTDDVELIARSAVGQLVKAPHLIGGQGVNGHVLADTCRWYAFRVTGLDDSRDRTEIRCRVVARGRFRDFVGFNRAKHAVVEAAILATRIEFLVPDEILSQYEQLAVLVEKTGGEQERCAFEFLRRYVEQAFEARQKSSLV